MKITIREALPGDLESLVEIEKLSFSPHQQNSKASYKNSIKSNSQEVLIVELKKGLNRLIIGSAVVFKFKKTSRIYSIALIPEFQGKGFGEKILNHIVELAKSKQINKIVLEVQSDKSQLVNWYEKNGFTVEKKLDNYYSYGIHALRMSLNLITNFDKSKSVNLIVINQPFKLDISNVNAKVISVKEYIKNTDYHNNSSFRVFNLCSSYKYQTYGYFVSLLASARGQKVIPNTATIRDFKINNVLNSLIYDIDEEIQKSLSKIEENNFSLNIYFGQSVEKGFKTISIKLNQLFDAPLFKVDFIKSDKWIIKDIKLLNLHKIDPAHIDLVKSYAEKYFNRKRYGQSKLTNFKYDLAILIDEKEQNPPSCPKALQKFKTAANKKGMYVEFINKNDVDRINEFDALFIRETTNVNDHTYEMSRLAYAEGLVVLDDPWSIMKCSNKIFQNEVFKKNNINTPKTNILTKNLFNSKDLDQLKFPLVLKQPDSAFSLGVLKANNKEEAMYNLTTLFKKSDMVVSQEFLYSEFDWRIGILDNEAIYACKYYMSKGHWQIYNWKGEEDQREGNYESFDLKSVPDNVIKTALKAARLMGDGLYGVDLKQVDNKVYVVEVNDNPNIDFGVEDAILGDKLYDIIMNSIFQKIEIAKNLNKINYTL